MNIFVIMPFDSEFNLIYRHLIKEPLEAHGDYTVSRADDNPGSQNLLEEIIQGIDNADLIVADLTGKNSNVYYELGIAHKGKKRTIQIVQDIEHIQFNLRAYNTVPYDVRPDGSSDLAEKLLEFIENPDYKYKNPVTDYSVSERTEPVFGSGAPDESRESADDDADDLDYGIFDARADADEALDIILGITKGIGSDVKEIGEKTAKHIERLNEINTDPNQRKVHSRSLQVIQGFAADVDSFCDSIDSRVPELRESWNQLDQGMGHVLLITSIEDEEDLQAALELVDSLEYMRKAQAGAIESISNFRDTHAGLIGISRVSNPALRRSIKSLDKLIKESELGDSIVTRIILLTEAMIARYNADST